MILCHVFLFKGRSQVNTQKKNHFLKLSEASLKTYIPRKNSILIEFWYTDIKIGRSKAVKVLEKPEKKNLSKSANFTSIDHSFFLPTKPIKLNTKKKEKKSLIINQLLQTKGKKGEEDNKRKKLFRDRSQSHWVLTFFFF